MWRGSVPRETMRDSVPCCSNSAIEQKSRHESSGGIPYLSLGGNAARPPRLGGYIKPLCVTWLWPSVAKKQMLTANFKTSDPAVVEPQSSSLALRKDFRMNFASALLSNFDVYTFTQVQFDRFDSLFGFHKFFLHTRRAYRHRSPPIGPNCTLPMFSKGGVWTNS